MEPSRSLFLLDHSFSIRKRVMSASTSTAGGSVVCNINSSLKKILRNISQESKPFGEDDIFFVYFTLDGFVLEMYESVLVNKSILVNVECHFKLLFPFHIFALPRSGAVAPLFDFASKDGVSSFQIAPREIDFSTLFRSLISFEGSTRMKINMDVYNSLDIYTSTEQAGYKLYSYEISRADLALQSQKTFVNEISSSQIGGVCHVSNFSGLCLVESSSLRCEEGLYIFGNTTSNSPFEITFDDSDWSLLENGIKEQHYIPDSRFLDIFQEDFPVVLRPPSEFAEKKFFSHEFMIGKVICLLYTL